MTDLETQLIKANWEYEKAMEELLHAVTKVIDSHEETVLMLSKEVNKLKGQVNDN